jgi:imidazolonepropionase-like amidohydrolase
LRVSAAVILPCLLVAGATAVAAADTWVIQNAKVVTVSGPVLERGSVVIKDGLIADVGPSVTVPPGAEVIDGTGLSVYPGLFDANSQLGMSEARENTFGDMTPELQVYASFHMDDEAIEMARANGVTHVLARPWQRGSGNGHVRPRSIITGQGAVMELEGWTPDARAVRKDTGLAVNFPSVGGLEYSEDERFAIVPWSAAKKKTDKAVADLAAFFAQARAYKEAKDKMSADERARALPDLRLESMIPVLEGKRPVLFDVDTRADIVAALEFAKAQRVTPILMGAQEAVLVADYIKRSGARVILAPPYAVPEGEDDPVDLFHRAAATLHAKGIPFAIASFGPAGSDSRGIGYQAGTAVAYGLPYEVALRSVTLTPAEMLGVADTLGSIDKGKRANLVLTDGDILEIATRVKRVFIGGKPVDLATRFDKALAVYGGRR